MAKKSFKPDYNACIGNNKHENFGSIYESMVKSEQFKALSSPARMLYVLCRIQHKSSAGKACLHNHSEEFGVVLRAKGMLPAEDGTWIYFDMVPGEHEVREGAPEYTGRICVIGSRLEEDKLEALFGLKK